MTRKLLALVIPLLFLFNVSIAKAQTITTSGAQAVTGSTSAEPGIKLKQQLQLLQAQKKTAVGQIKDDLKASIQAKKEEFKAKLLTIIDQKKKALVELIDARLAEVNKKQTDDYTVTLTQLQSFLDKISQSASGTAKMTAITSTQNSINAAKTAVEAQAAKAYTMTIDTDTTLKLNAGIIVNQFRQDISSTRGLVLGAKQAVQALSPIRPTIKPLIKNEASSSAKI